MNRNLENFKLLNAEKEFNLRKILAEDFKSLNGELPIKGGWGYNIEDAIIIDKFDETVDKAIPFDGIALEYLIVEKRIYEELIIFRKKREKFCHIEWKPSKQSLLHREGKNYDHLIIEGTCFIDKDFEMLKREYEENISNPDFNLDEHKEKV